MRTLQQLVMFSVVVLLLALGRPAWAGPMTVEPSALNFPDAGLGVQSPAQQVSFKNGGNQAISVTGVVINGANPPDFMLEAMPQLPFSVGPGATFDVSVRFMPTLGGTHHATLTAVVGGGFDDTTVLLTGLAVQPIIQLSTGQNPSNVADFDQVQMTIIGAESEAITVTIKVPTNGSAVSLGEITSSNPIVFRVDTSVTQMDLSPGQQTTFNIYFRPNGGPTSAVITVALRDVSASPASITVRGTGTYPGALGIFFARDDGCSMGRQRSLPGAISILLVLPGIALLLRRHRSRSTASVGVAT